MDTLTEGLNVGDARKIDNSVFMPVYIKHIGLTDRGPLFSIAHYYKQNGDLMKDPDMVFLKMNTKYYPVSFQQDGGAGFYQEAVVIKQNRVTGYRPPILDELVSFANGWMRNIKEQQEL